MIKKISLWDASLCLIIEHPSGIVYENQVGGGACLQRQTSGFLAPLDTEVAVQFEGRYQTVEQHLIDYFGDGFYQGSCHGPLSEDDAKMINALLSCIVDLQLQIDPTRIEHSCEAWVPVLLDLCATDPCPAFQGFVMPATAILTWPNSD